MRARTMVAGATLAACAALTACGGGSHHPASSEVSHLAANPTASADAHAAVTLLRACAKAHPTIGGTKTCVENAVPKSQRTATGKCLAAVYGTDLEHASATGAKAKVKQAWTVFTTSNIPGYSGNNCLPANLR